MNDPRSRMCSSWLSFALVSCVALLIGGLTMAVRSDGDNHGVLTSMAGEFPTAFNTAEKTVQHVHLDRVLEYIEQGSAVIVDARSTERFKQGHLPGALSVPARNPRAPLPRGLTQYKDHLPVVVYCESSTCTDADSAAKRLVGLGFPRVFILSGGWEAWVERSSGS